MLYSCCCNILYIRSCILYSACPSGVRIAKLTQLIVYTYNIDISCKSWWLIRRYITIDQVQMSVCIYMCVHVLTKYTKTLLVALVALCMELAQF